MTQFKEVTQEQFYDYVGPRDIVLRTERDEVIWETRSRSIVGRSTPGYMSRGPKAYFLAWGVDE
jgi:hypothetical protein